MKLSITIFLYREKCEVPGIRLGGLPFVLNLTINGITLTSAKLEVLYADQVLYILRLLLLLLF